MKQFHMPLVTIERCARDVHGRNAEAHDEDEKQERADCVRPNIHRLCAVDGAAKTTKPVSAFENVKHLPT